MITMLHRLGMCATLNQPWPCLCKMILFSAVLFWMGNVWHCDLCVRITNTLQWTLELGEGTRPEFNDSRFPNVNQYDFCNRPSIIKLKAAHGERKEFSQTFIWFLFNLLSLVWLAKWQQELGKRKEVYEKSRMFKGDWTEK